MKHSNTHTHIKKALGETKLIVCGLLIYIREEEKQISL